VEGHGFSRAVSTIPTIGFTAEGAHRPMAMKDSVTPSRWKAGGPSYREAKGGAFDFFFITNAQ
jgi:hypothetical protein